MNRALPGFPRTLKALMKAHGYTDEALARVLGRSGTTITYLKNGHTQPPVEILLALRTLFGVTLDQMAGLDTVPPAPFPPWIAPLFPKLMALDPKGRAAVEYILESLPAREADAPDSPPLTIGAEPLSNSPADGPPPAASERRIS
jgi:transcriptional regulator with XRE-family HTH domain